MPNGANFLDLFNQDPSAFNIAGGFDIAQLQQQADQFAAQAEATRMEFGRSLLQDILAQRADPFAIQPAMQMAGATGAGGGISPFVTGFGRTGGVGQPAPPAFADVATNLMRQLGIYAGGSPINPNTGRPYTPQEIAFLNIIAARRPAPQPTSVP